MALFRKADLQNYNIKKSFSYETAESILKKEASAFSPSKFPIATLMLTI